MLCVLYVCACGVMDALVSAARKLGVSGSGSVDDQHQAMAQLCRRFDGQQKTIKKNAGVVDSLLAERVLEPAVQPFACTQLLLCRLELVDLRSAQQAAAALTLCLPALHELFAATHSSLLQLHYCFPEYFHLALLTTRLSIAAHRPAAPLASFALALEALQLHFPLALTPLHSCFVQLCVRAKHLRLCERCVCRPVYGIRHKQDGLDAVLYLEFLYYSAVVHAAFKRWRQAVEALQLCLSVPGNAVSALQVAAYKKLQLVSLLADGEPPTLPQRTTPTAVLRHIEPLVLPYSELARAFAKQLNAAIAASAADGAAAAAGAAPSASPAAAVTGNSSSLPSASSSSSSSSALSGGQQDVPSLASSHSDVFAADRNLGLVRQCEQELSLLRIARLTSTYLTLPLQSLSGLLRASSQQVERWLQLLISRSAIAARVDSRQGLVSFLVDAEADGGLQDERARRRLDEQIVAVLSVRQSVIDINRRIAASPVFIAKTLPSDREEAAAADAGKGDRDKDAMPGMAGAARGALSRGGGGRAGGAGGALSAAAEEELQLRAAITQSLTQY